MGNFRSPQLGILTPLLTHHQILIEQAIADRANVIIAPEGIAGNLIYRTLIHLGAGRSYGAVYLLFYNNHDRKIIIDCSRVAPLFEIEGSFYLALGLPGRDVVEE